MKHLATIALAFGISLTAATVASAQHGGHRMVMPGDLKWANVPSLPPGAQISAIEGPMNEAVPFTIRLKSPKDYVIPAHSHPAIERVTVISGTFHMGTGDKFDKTKTHALTPGAIGIMQPGTNHFAWTDAETNGQVNRKGPRGGDSVKPAGEPRKS